MEEKKYPIGGYAPGDYWHKACNTCGKEFTGDKRAWNCEPCGEENAAVEKKLIDTYGYEDLADYLSHNHKLKLLQSEISDLIHYVHKFHPQQGATHRSQILQEYKQYKENLKFLGGATEWTYDKVVLMNKIELFETIKGFNELITFLDSTCYAYEEGAKDWEERALKAEGRPAPVWVKASTRVPADQMNQHCKINGIKCIASYNKHHDMFQNIDGDLFPLDQVKWLCEGATAGREEAFAEWAMNEGWECKKGKGWSKHSEETPYVLTTAQLYDIFKQQKEG